MRARRGSRRTQVLTHLPWFILVGKSGESARTVLMGAEIPGVASSSVEGISRVAFQNRTFPPCHRRHDIQPQVAMRNFTLALRTLARTPIVTAIAVLSLGLGIGS